MRRGRGRRDWGGTELVGQSGGVEGVGAERTGQEAEQRARLSAIDDSLKHLRAETQAAQEKRSQIELELVKRQAELKYLDETSRKELNAPLEELAAQDETVLDDAGRGEAAPRFPELRAPLGVRGWVGGPGVCEDAAAAGRAQFGAASAGRARKATIPVSPAGPVVSG